MKFKYVMKDTEEPVVKLNIEFNLTATEIAEIISSNTDIDGMRIVDHINGIKKQWTKTSIESEVRKTLSYIGTEYYIDDDEDKLTAAKEIVNKLFRLKKVI